MPVRSDRKIKLSIGRWFLIGCMASCGRNWFAVVHFVLRFVRIFELRPSFRTNFRFRKTCCLDSINFIWSQSACFTIPLIVWIQVFNFVLFDRIFDLLTSLLFTFRLSLNESSFSKKKINSFLSQNGSSFKNSCRTVLLLLNGAMESLPAVVIQQLLIPLFLKILLLFKILVFRLLGFLVFDLPSRRLPCYRSRRIPCN